VTRQTIAVPDIGGAEDVEVIEISVAPGQQVQEEETLIVLESDKASMEIPCPSAGKVVEITLTVGDKVSKGSAILVLEAEAASAAPAQPEAQPAAAAQPQPAAPSAPQPEPKAPAAAKPAQTAGAVETVTVPDIGGANDVDVIEVNVKVGDTLAEGDAMIVLESDKASMEVPAPKAGTVRAIKVKEGDKVSQGSPVLELEVSGDAPAAAAETATPAAPAQASQPQAQTAVPEAPAPSAIAMNRSADADVYAGPAVRKLAREMGIDLVRVAGSGPKGRIQKDDVKQFVKELVEHRGGVVSGAGIPPIPDIDFTQFGAIDKQPLSKTHKLTAANMQRNWLNVPHVTQFDDVDVTELENFRKALKAEAEQRGVKVSPLPFLLKACAAALKVHPKFNASLHADGEHIVYKKYVHIGVAVDTPIGLVVPVVRDADRKSLWELAAETA
jgi:pyruvate dehydrogenase E2 component (dihydrolipoamide acetyltransferase)